MKVLIACEESQTVCAEFRKLGIEAYSCDILETSGQYPEFHFKRDVTELLKENWNLIIAFPPCTDLAVSGARWFPLKIANGSQQRSIEFFKLYTTLNCPFVAIENPIGIMSSLYRKPDQIIQPWQFGHGELKATCLWLKGLPPLDKTDIVEGRLAKVHRMPPGPERAKLRSKTYPGIARAMAEQWGSFVLNSLSVFCAVMFLYSCGQAFVLTPKYKPNDTVYNYRNGLTYVIDSVIVQRKHPKQIFYSAHSTSGVVVKWLPEISIKWFPKSID